MARGPGHKPVAGLYPKPALDAGRAAELDRAAESKWDAAAERPFQPAARFVVCEHVAWILAGALVLWVAWLITGPNALFFLLAIPSLISVILRATSVEFWNQWIMTSVNLLFFGLLILYLRRPLVWKIPLLIVPMLLAPALYLAGLDNAIVFFLLSAVVVAVRRPQGRREAWLFSGLACLILVGLAFWLTWLPYFKTIGTNAVGRLDMSMADFEKRATLSIQTVLDFPLWGVTHWAYKSDVTFYQSSSAILPASAAQLLRVARFLNLGQGLLFSGVLITACGSWIYKRRPFNVFFEPGRLLPGLAVLLGLAYVILAFALSPFLNGPVWAERERMDQTVQFLPFFLFAWIGFPFMVRLPRLVRVGAVSVTIGLAAAFSMANLVLGFQVVQSHLDYRGSVITEADVPLQQKEQVVDFIARDWMSLTDNKKIPVAYNLGVGKWRQVTQGGYTLVGFYPAPYTMGRGFDFELLRRYGLHNSQEGIQDRPLFPNRYIVSYTSKPAPSQAGLNFKEYIFGRLRVSVVQ